MISYQQIKYGIHWLRGKRKMTFFYVLLYFLLRRRNTIREILQYARVRRANKGRRNVQILVNDSKMMIDLADTGISRQLCLHRKREHFSTDFVKKTIRDDDIIIDIGANIGYYALLEARLSCRGKVYAIEPVPANVHLLENNIALNGYQNVSVFQYAIGDREKTCTMYVYDKGNWSSFTKNVYYDDPIREIEVRVIPLDKFINDYLDEYPTFIRMDVEGYELQILKGMCKVLDSGKPLILFLELHPHLMDQEDMNQLLHLLKKSDFEVEKIFIEAAPGDFHNIDLINKIFRKIAIPEIGFIRNGYDNLRDVLARRNFSSTMAFFKRYSGHKS